MLDLARLRSGMTTLGLSGAALAERCGVSKEAVSNWLSGESFPRPGKLSALARALHVEVDELLLPDADAVPEPVVAYRTKDGQPPSVAAKEAADEVGRHLRQLLPYLRPVLTARLMAEPSADESSARDLAAWVASRLRAKGEGSATHERLIALMQELGITLVPVWWNGDRAPFGDALSVFLPDSSTAWVVFDVGCRLEDFSYWLAHELAHCLTLHVLSGEAGEAFAEQFASELLSLEFLPLDATSFSASEGRTVSEAYFGVPKPSMDDLVTRAPEAFGTQVFQAMAQWQKSEGGRAPAFVAAALAMKLGDATELARALDRIAE